MGTLETKQFESLTKLRQEQAASMFLPNGLEEEAFIFSEVVYDSGFVRRLAIEFSYLNEPLQFLVVNTNASSRIIDIEDFTVQSHNINNVEVTAYSDEQGFSVIEWELGQYRLELSGHISAEELLETGLALGLFN